MCGPFYKMSRPGFRVSDQLLQNIVFPTTSAASSNSVSFFSVGANLSNIRTVYADTIIASNLQGTNTAQLGDPTTGFLSIGVLSASGTFTNKSNATIVGVGALGAVAKAHLDCGGSVVIGRSAAYTASNVFGSVIIGSNTMYSGTGSNSVVIGNGTGYNSTVTNSVIIGKGSVPSAIVGNSIIIGPDAGGDQTSLAHRFIVNNISDTSFRPLLYGVFRSASTQSSTQMGSLGIHCVPNLTIGVDIGSSARIQGILYPTQVGVDGEYSANFAVHSSSNRSYQYAFGTPCNVGSILGGCTLSGGSGTAVAWNATSDERLKTDIRPLSNGLETVEQLHPKTYSLTSDTQPIQRYGLLAQDILPILPSLVDTDVCGYYSLNYTGLIPFLVKSIQELTERVQTLEARLSQPSS